MFSLKIQGDLMELFSTLKCGVNPGFILFSTIKANGTE